MSTTSPDSRQSGGRGSGDRRVRRVLARHLRRWSRHVFGVVLVLVLAVLPHVAHAQSAPDPVVAASLTNVSRVEAWRFFEPRPGGGDPDYTLLGNRATLGIVVDARRFGVRGAFQYAQLVGLPQFAVGPGPLGPGALFHTAAQSTRALQLYIKAMSLEVKDIVPGLSAEGGRMRYESGEGTPFDGLLIGDARWTMFERAFDGARADFRRGDLRVHGAFVMPTQGAYEESASPTLGNVQIASVSLRRRGLEAFAHNYRDTRAVRARPDNTGAAAGAIDVGVQTFGASWAMGSPFTRGAAGTFDLALWGAVQRGNWYGETHRAASGIATAGYRWTGAWGRPSIGGGVLLASGDNDPGDGRHETFFSMVPTTRPDALAGTFAQMNLIDRHIRAGVTPHERVEVAAEVHQLSLANAHDRWYSGTGATALDGDYFGFSTRPSTIARGLGTLLQVTTTARVTSFWRLTASMAVVRGGDVVQRQFAGRTLRTWMIESRVAVQ